LYPTAGFLSSFIGVALLCFLFFIEHKNLKNNQNSIIWFIIKKDRLSIFKNINQNKMKSPRLLLAFAAIFILHFNGFPALPLSTSPSLPATTVVASSQLTAKEQFRIAQMKKFTSLSVGEYGKLRGEKLNFFEKISFKLSQRRMKQMLRHYEYGEVTTLQKISWLLKGLLLGPIAVALAYIFIPEDDRELIKWVWFGFAGFAIIVAIILLSL
jgi:hypothetical protein